LARGKRMPKETGRRFRCRADPRRFGRILNVSCERDAVQVDRARVWSGRVVPRTRGFGSDLMTMLKTVDAHERPGASRKDPDPRAADLYEDLEVMIAPDCRGVEAHGLLHGATAGRCVGRWLESGDSMAAVIGRFGPCRLCGR
jgi:hypothetical protein